MFSLEPSLLARLTMFGTDIAKTLGLGRSHLSIIISAILAITSFFYIFTLGSFFNVNVFVLENGITNDTFFYFFLIDRSVDHIIIAFGVVSWLALSLCGRSRFVLLAIYGGLAVTAAVIDNLTIFLDIVALS